MNRILKFFKDIFESFERFKKYLRRGRDTFYEIKIKGLGFPCEFTEIEFQLDIPESIARINRDMEAIIDIWQRFGISVHEVSVIVNRFTSEYLLSISEEIEKDLKGESDDET